MADGYESLRGAALAATMEHLRAAEARRLGQAAPKGEAAAALSRSALDAVARHHEAMLALRADAAPPPPLAGTPPHRSAKE